MKKIIPLLLLTLMTAFTACEEPIEELPALEVNYINLDGTWQLAEWRGEPLAEGTWLSSSAAAVPYTMMCWQAAKSSAL